MARREISFSCKLACVVGMRHTLMLPGIDADMREFGELGIRKHERELQEANADEIDTLLTMLKLRDDWQGREMAWWLQWILLKAETRRRRRYSGFDLAKEKQSIKIFVIFSYELAPGARRHEHAHHVIFYDEQPDGVLITGIIHERSICRLRDSL